MFLVLRIYSPGILFALAGLLIAPLRADPAAKNLLPPITDVQIGPRDWKPGVQAPVQMPDPNADPTAAQDPNADPTAAPDTPPGPTDPAGPPKPVTHGWVLFVSGAAQATPLPTDQTLKIDIPAADGTDWHVRLAYDAPIVNGQLYELRFRAKTDAARFLSVASEVGSNNVWPGLFRRVALTTDWQTFARRFVAQKAEAGKNILPEFWMGDKSGSVSLSDVTLTPLPAGSSLLPPVTDAAAWEFAEQRPDSRLLPAAGPPASAAPTPLTKMATDGDGLKFTLDARPSGYWSVWQAHAALKENTAYTLSFRAKADPPRDLPLHGDVESPGVAPEGLDDKVKVKRDWQTFSVAFTTKTGSKENHVVPQFMVGSQLGSLWLSDVSLTEGAAPTPVADTPAAPPAAADAAPKPAAGEIALTGKVTSVRAAAHTLSLAVSAVTTADGKVTTLPTSRPKTIIVGASTPLANLKPGTTVTVVGTDSGSGKSFHARALAVTP